MPKADERGANAELIAKVEQIGAEVARPAAADVDARARFPEETLTALRKVGALGAAVPKALGGAGADTLELVRMCGTLGQNCASSAMVLAMHHIQVLSIANHRADSKELGDYLESVARDQRLIASVTSEVGPSGDMRKSVAAVEQKAGGFELTKQATTASYGQQADDLLITARRNPDAAPSDQVLVLAPRGTHTLSNVGAWDTMGMRGTCSPGGTVRVVGQLWQIVPEPFGKIATDTMTPASHILWGSCWLGIASDAVSKAQTIFRGKGRAEPGVVPRSAQQLSELVGKHQLMRNELQSLAEEYDGYVRGRDADRLASVSFALRINNLKLSASRLVVEIVSDALRICGIAAYKNDTPFSLGRHLRDAYSAALMINNERIHETNASLLLVHKGT